MKSILIAEEYHNILEKLSQRLDKPKKQVVEQTLYFIYKQRIDPEKVKDANPYHAIDKLRNDLIGFIKTQEKTKFDPLLDNLSITAMAVNEALDEMPKKAQVEEVKEGQESLQSWFIEAIKKQNNIANLVQKILEDKKYLKQAFLLLFREYVKEREATNSFMNKKEIQALHQKYEQKIKHL